MFSRLMPGALNLPDNTNIPPKRVGGPVIYLAPASSFRSGIVLKTIALQNERDRMIKHKEDLIRQLSLMDGKIETIEERIRLNDIEKYRHDRKN